MHGWLRKHLTTTHKRHHGSQHVVLLGRTASRSLKKGSHVKGPGESHEIPRKIAASCRNRSGQPSSCESRTVLSRSQKSGPSRRSARRRSSNSGHPMKSSHDSNVSSPLGAVAWLPMTIAGIPTAGAGPKPGVRRAAVPVAIALPDAVLIYDPCAVSTLPSTATAPLSSGATATGSKFS